MQCEDVQRGLSRGELPAGVDEHIVGCEGCAARVVRYLEAQQAAVLPDAAGLRASLEAQLALETGPIAFLRSRTSGVRLGLAFGASALLVLAIALRDARPDLGRLSSGTLLSILGLSLAFLAVLPEALRPLHAPAREGLRRSLVLMAFALPVLAAVLCATAASAQGSIGPRGCLGFGAAIALLVVVVLRILDRGGSRSPSAALLRMAGAGMVANVALSLHCADERLSHLLTWHVPVALTLAGTYFVARSLARVRT
ncbi:MAG: hypothetical protein ACHQ53_08600 [Polyangiales bacterium]